MDKILLLFCEVFFKSSNRWSVLFAIVRYIGLYKMFEKSGVKGWWTFIPGAREYMLSKCAGREPEGRVYSIVEVLSIVLSVISLFVPSMVNDEFTIAGVFIVIGAVTLGLVSFIYVIRIWSGILDVYGLRKRWLFLCVFSFSRAVVALVLGLNNKYQPAWQVEDIQNEMAKLASSGSASVMNEGLTVNLKERTVTEFFQKKTLLRDIHMSIPQGHMVLLLGGSGAGKTTYLNAINGYEKANAEVLLNGTNLYTQYKKMQYEVGFVPQTEMMRGKDTVLSTLLDAAKLRLPKDVSSKQRRERVDEVMGIFGLKPVQNNLVEKLSGGQKKRLSISMEFISNPSLFILDEPDSGLDGVMARELFEQLRKIADTGKIVIVITHTPDRVIDLFDDVIVLAKDSARTGRLAFYGSIEEARSFFGRDRMEQIVKSVNRKEEGGDGLADEFVMKYAEVHHG
ncbi:MAG: ABC transporter ATP-binding protein [Clostridia bacterium]|nr:ABC transporter ATP-binding protein [Clostridia bacterium]